MKGKLLSCVLFVLKFGAGVFAQTPPPRMNIYSSVVGNNSEPIIYNTVNLNTYELLTTNIQVSKEDNLQKIVFAPFKLVDFSGNDNFAFMGPKKRFGFLRETRVNLAQKNGISTIGIGFGFDNSSPFSNRGDKKIKAFKIASMRAQKGDEKDYEYEAYKSAYKKGLSEEYVKVYEDLLSNSFKLTIGYNLSLFEVIGGDRIDLDKDGVIDNFYGKESDNFSLGITYTFSRKVATSLTSHYSGKLSSPKGNEKKVDYFGGSFAFAGEVFILNKDYEKTSDYLKSFFVPAIIAGFSIEYQHATTNKSYAKDGITNNLAITPFLDFRINPKNQFRIGIPVKKYSGIKDEVSFGPFLQWTLQIAKVE